ncbi:hypothetical protein ACSVIJ_04315 [Pseudomonas sp. NCHU5208]|uniref:hypothetical protein n=1 Tax=unclassified Pseudomonas TaxID=196821 RepID=UPI003F95777B
MLIDFQDTYRRFLTAKRRDSGRWAYELANPENPAAGTYLSHHQVFSNAAVGFGIYLRNYELDAECAFAGKVQAGLKLLFSRKQNGRYTLHNDPGRISLTLDIDGTLALYRWLSGDVPSLSYELARSGADYRTLSGYQADRAFALIIRASSSSADSRAACSIDVGLSEADILHLQLHCIGLLKLSYPTLPDEILMAHMRARTGIRSVRSPSEESSGSEERRCEEPSLNRTEEGCSKAIYAIGMQKWARRHLPTIEFLQSQGIDRMDQLIQDANQGDFSEWERVFAALSRTSL